MHAEQVREVFNQATATTSDPEAIARIELAREYFSSPTFRKALADYVWSLNKSTSK